MTNRLNKFAAATLATAMMASLPMAAQAKKTHWCAVEKKTGDYTSNCFPKKEECLKFVEKKGGGKMECGVSHQ
jgi:hypothetical protein